MPRLTKPKHIGYKTAIEFSCENCGIKAWEKKSHFERKKRHFCSIPKEEHPRFGTGFHAEERKKRMAARSILNHHLRDKKIERPNCELCGAKNAEAHHDDYSKPLEVKWLCFKYHRAYHKIGDKIYDNPELLKS